MTRWAALLPVLPLVACGSGGGDGELLPPPPPSDTDPPELALHEVASGFINPVHVTHAGDGSGRVFVVSQSGRIHIVDDGDAMPVTFLDIAGDVLDGGERGLLSVAFPPAFDERQTFYVNYTAVPDGRTVVSRFHVSAADPDSANPGSEEVLLTQTQPGTNHNGGLIKFGPDGYLYVAMGDGGSATPHESQQLDSLLGAMLRIDVEDEDSPGAYLIPPDNPFVDEPDAEAEIWAYGLRNPWRFSFDRDTGDLYIADVGQSSREEVNFQPAGSEGGENYGWPLMEGTLCYQPPSGCDAEEDGLTLPVHEYDHGAGDRSITGGYVYRGSAIPGLQGVYVYGDFGSGRIWGLRRDGDDWSNELLLESGLALSSFGEDEAGELYLTDHASGRLFRLTAVGARLEIIP